MDYIIQKVKSPEDYDVFIHGMKLTLGYTPVDQINHMIASDKIGYLAIGNVSETGKFPLWGIFEAKEICNCKRRINENNKRLKDDSIILSEKEKKELQRENEGYQNYLDKGFQLLITLKEIRDYGKNMPLMLKLPENNMTTQTHTYVTKAAMLAANQNDPSVWNELNTYMSE